MGSEEAGRCSVIQEMEYSNQEMLAHLKRHTLRWSKQFPEMQPIFMFISFTLASSASQHKVSHFKSMTAFDYWHGSNNDVFVPSVSLSIIIRLNFQDQTPSWVNICGGTYLFSEDKKSWFTAWNIKKTVMDIWTWNMQISKPVLFTQTPIDHLISTFVSSTTFFLSMIFMTA